MCKAEDEVQLPPWNFNDDSSGQGPSQIPAVSKGLKEDRHHIVNCVREKETGCRELTEMKEGELHQFTLRPRLGRRAVKKTDGHIKCDKPINQAYQYNFDRERPAHRALVAHDVERCYNTKTKSIRRRAEESSRVLCDFRKVPEVRKFVFQL